MRIQIIGMGIVGSTIANNILVGFFDLKELYICDKDKGNLLGQFRDLSDAKIILGRDIKIYPTAKPIRKADIHIVCVGDRSYVKDMAELMPQNYELVLSLIRDIKGTIIIVTNPADDITGKLKTQGFPVTEGGITLDVVRLGRGYTGKDIRLLKGFTNFGISAEILMLLRGKSLFHP